MASLLNKYLRYGKVSKTHLFDKILWIARV